MRFNITIFSTFLILSTVLTGCPSPEPPKANSNANQSSTNKTDANSTLATTKTPLAATTNDAPTLSPVFKAFCDAHTKKDEAALRRLFAAATLKSIEADMKADGQKSLLKFLEADQISNELCEVRNEKIDGDVGVAEVKTKGSPNGIKLKFLKENGEWKVTTDIPDFEEVKKAAEAAQKNNPANTSNAPAVKK